MYGGLAVCLILIVFSPAVSGPAGPSATAMITAVDFHWFPLSNPGIVSIPVSFLLGVIGTFVGRDRDARSDGEDRFAEMEVRSMTGAGSG